MERFKLRYLPLFEKDLYEAVSYISDVLKNPQAAHRLLNEVEKSIKERLKMPLSLSHTVQRKNVKMIITAFMSEITRFSML